jgi:general stress protein 26
MATQKVANGRLYFFTSKSSPKQSEINEDASVNISYADPESQVYVSVSGKAAVSTAAEHIREAWTESARRWFPEGPQDPNLALLTVEISQAEFWDVDMKAMASLVDRSASAEEIIAATDHRKLA